MFKFQFLSLVIFSLLSLVLFAVPSQALAQQKQITIVNPLRGGDFWNHPFSFLETPKKQYEVISQNNLAASWLVRYDALKDPEVVNFLKSIDQKQEVGIFLEITPTLTKDAGVNYNESPNWHYPKSAFLVGYSLTDRTKLIDQAVSKYQEIFNKDPKSVGAWWIDAYSLNYLHEKYAIEANLDVSDQYSTDQYQIWGQYFSTPFYPSKINALVPAKSKEDKLEVVTFQWATRDPFNSYGRGVFDSTFSVQLNDYLLHDLDISYFNKLLDIYPFVTVGLENDFSFKEFGNEYINQINLVAQKVNSGQARALTLLESANYYKRTYSNLSPNVLIEANDPLGSEGKVVWYQTPRFRVGWFYTLDKGSVIKDLRLYGDTQEPCFKVSCSELNLATFFLDAIDQVTYGNEWVIDQGKISNIRIEQGENVTISYLNQTGTQRTIKFLSNDIEIDGQAKTISEFILNATLKSKSEDSGSKIGASNFFLRENILLKGWEFSKFIILTLLFFLLPGLLLSRSWLLSIPIGWVVFTTLSYILGFLNFNLALWLIPAFSVIALLKVKLPKISQLSLNRENMILSITIFLGSITWLLTSIKNGMLFEYGFGYWGPHGHDGIWHLSLISELQRNFPPQNPVFAGDALNNYHYFYDLLLARSGQLFLINSQDLLFRFFPIFISILCGLILFKLVEKLKFPFWARIFSLFFLYFGGSFGWIVSYFKVGDFGGESLFWAQQAISTLINPPFAISLVLLLSGYYLLLEYLEKPTKYLILIISLLLGTLIEFKAYGGVLALGALGLVCLEKIIFQKDFKLLPPLVGSMVVAALVFLPNNLSSGALFIFQPLWLVSSMISSADRLNWQRLMLALDSGDTFKVLAGNILGIIIFVFGNLGTRLIGFFTLINIQLRFLFWIAILGIIIPLLFIQKGNSWNVIQFFYYAIFAFNIFAGLGLYLIWKKLGVKLGSVVCIAVILLTIPTTINTLNHYLPQRPPARIPLEEIEALEFLKRQPQGVVLTLPFDQKSKNKYSEPVPLFAYTPTSYVSAFSDHPTFLEDTINLEILGVDYQGRLNEAYDFTKIINKSREVLKRNNISYLYIVNDFEVPMDEGRMGIKKIFENKWVKIYEVDKEK